MKEVCPVTIVHSRASCNFGRFPLLNQWLQPHQLFTVFLKRPSWPSAGFKNSPCKTNVSIIKFHFTRTAQQPLHPCKYLRQNLHTESEHDQIKKKALKRVAERECLNKNTSSVISVPMQVLTVAEKVWQVSTPTASQNARTTCGDPQPIPRN
jgi:hypothetical protein